MHTLLVHIGFVALGGAFGSVLRYLVAGWTQQALPASTFPLGTLTVNIIGCLVIGLLAAAFESTRVLVAEPLRLAIMVGVLGGFTTFSTFGLETLNLLRSNQLLAALVNVTLSVTLGLLAAWLGYRVGVRTFGV